MRRITRLLLLAALGVGMLVVPAAPAGAVGESVEACTIEAVQERIEETEDLEPGTPEYEAVSEETEEIVAECIESPNVLLPATNEVLWGGVGFLIVLLFMLKFGYPAVKKSMNERTARIESDLDAAETAKSEAEDVKAEYAAKLADAKSESARIIEEARQAADQLKSDQQARLNEELAAQREQAQADIDAAKGRAMGELRAEVSEIAVGAAERVVGANLDRAAQDRLIEDYINDVSNGSQS